MHNRGCFIENVSKNDVIEGCHSDPGEHSMLIQILDPGAVFPVPLHQYKESYQFQFLDAEDDVDVPDELKISMSVAKLIYECLERAVSLNMNVIVHCWAGRYRSGAVAEVGVSMGFRDTHRFRTPNSRVYNYIKSCEHIRQLHRQFAHTSKAETCMNEQQILANAAQSIHASDFQFTYMQDGVDYGCTAKWETTHISTSFHPLSNNDTAIKLANIAGLDLNIIDPSWRTVFANVIPDYRDYPGCAHANDTPQARDLRRKITTAITQQTKGQSCTIN